MKLPVPSFFLRRKKRPISPENVWSSMEDFRYGETMRVLVLHPEDGPGTLLQGSWDLVIDLGIAGAGTYDGWSKSFRCPVEPLPKLGLEDFKQVRQTLFSGLGRMVDGHGFDWW